MLFSEAILLGSTLVGDLRRCEYIDEEFCNACACGGAAIVAGYTEENRETVNDFIQKTWPYVGNLVAYKAGIPSLQGKASTWWEINKFTKVEVAKLVAQEEEKLGIRAEDYEWVGKNNQTETKTEELVKCL